MTKADDRLMVQQLIEVLGEVDWLTANQRAEVENVAGDHDGELTPEQEHGLLTRIVEQLREAASRAGDQDMIQSLSGDPRRVAARIIARYRTTTAASGSASRPRREGVLNLMERSNVEVGPVRPTPIFHGRAVPMVQGFVRVMDVAPWPKNVRLEIHLAHFQEHHGRSPNKDELLAIIQGKLVMPGLVKAHEDEFEVANLARSIAANGVQRPPIFDVDSTLLEGNRRIAACYLILESAEFTSEEKARAEYIFVWRLTEHATDADREAVIVASNFEPDYKKEWADYIKAKKIYDEWEAMLSLEPTANARRQSDMKRELAHRFGMGPDTTPINRYIKMIDWANDFEVFEAVERNRDVHAVRHQANRYFQYFDELSKGAKPGGVAFALGQDEALKHLAFDLLYGGKLASWMPIRGLKYVPESAEARSLLEDALAQSDVETAQELVEAAIKVARPIPGAGRGDPNPRIEDFCKFLLALPVSAFKTKVTVDSRKRLKEALEYVQRVFAAADASELS